MNKMLTLASSPRLQAFKNSIFQQIITCKSLSSQKICHTQQLSSKISNNCTGMTKGSYYRLSSFNYPLKLLNQANRYSFSTSNQGNNQNDDKNNKDNKGNKDKKDKQSQDKDNTQNRNSKDENSGVSLYQIYQYFENINIAIFKKLQKMNKFQIGMLVILPIIISYFLSQEGSQQYPRNYFQEQLKKDASNSTELTVRISASKDQVTYKVYFTKGGSTKLCYVNYAHDIKGFKDLIASLLTKPKIQYIYQPNFEVKLSTVALIVNIISVVFITSFFLKTSSLSSIKKGSSSSTNLNDMLNNKKSFQIITDMKVRFKNVAGLDQSKLEVREFVDFLKNPQKYKKLGARIPKGVLLTGPPGTGKTLLAKACAGQAGVPFIATSGSDFIQIFVGVGASRVRDLFALAKKNSPSIIFIDQIDAVGRKRSGGHGSHDERDNTLNQILVEMDGFQTDKNVIVMAATNRPNLLDDALVRPGRFDRIVQVNLPDLEGRRQIFNVHLERVSVQSSKTKDQYARRLATLTPGFSGAEIANLCNEAAILAARHNKNNVDSHDLEMATERIIGGIQRKGIMSSEQKRVVSVHESGHAVVSWFLEGADPLLKLTIIPRSKGSLGFAQYFVNQTKLNTKRQLIDRICFILGGRCAEEKFFGKITNGASDDLRKAYELAHNIVVKLGMSEEIGYIGFKDPEYLRPYSEQMGAKIDRQIQKILQQCTQRTKKIVAEHEHHIKALSDLLFDKETLAIKQIRSVLGDRPFISGESYEKYLELEREQEIKKNQATVVSTAFKI